MDIPSILLLLSRKLLLFLQGQEYLSINYLFLLKNDYRLCIHIRHPKRWLDLKQD